MVGLPARDATKRLRITVYGLKRSDGQKEGEPSLGDRLVGEIGEGADRKKVLAQKPETLGALIAKSLRNGVLAENIVIVSDTQGISEELKASSRGDEAYPLSQEDVESVQKALREEQTNITGVMPIYRDPKGDT
jgi:hypothetical protein